MQIEIPDELIDALRDSLNTSCRSADRRKGGAAKATASVRAPGCRGAGVQPLVCVRPNTWRAPRSDSDGAQLPGYIRNPGALCGGTWQTALRTLRSDGVPSSRSSRGSQPHGRRATSRSTTVASLVPATRAPRGPRPKQTRMSKEELAESRWTVTQLADRWWGFDSANALLLRSEVVMEEDSVRGSTFRYGDLLIWVDANPEDFSQWLHEFDPVFNQVDPFQLRRGHLMKGLRWCARILSLPNR